MLTFCRRRPLCAAALIVTVALVAGGAVAEPAPPFPALLQQAQARAPRLAESQAGVAQAEGLARQAGVRPNPTLGLEVENFAGTGPFQGFRGAEATASVAQTLELGGKRPARIAAGAAEIDAARARGQQAAAEFGFDLAEAYAQAEAADLRVQVAMDALSLAEDDSRVASALVQAGKESDLRSVQARAAIQSARAALEEARARRAEAFAKLTALAGSDQPFTAITASLLAHADRTETAPVLQPATGPAYRAAEAAREAAARRVRVEQTRAKPDLTVSVGARRLEGEDATALVGGVSAPLPIFDRNRGNISAAQAELRAAEARLNAARLEGLAQAASAGSRLTAAQTRIAAAKEAESAAEEAYRLTRIGYEGGKLPLSEVLSARRILADVHAQSIDARLERLSAEAAIARLQGVAPFGDQP